jgi:hypothetical protein
MIFIGGSAECSCSVVAVGQDLPGRDLPSLSRSRQRSEIMGNLRNTSTGTRLEMRNAEPQVKFQEGTRK